MRAFTESLRTAMNERVERRKKNLRRAWWQRRIDHIFYVPICGMVILALKWVLKVRIQDRDAWRTRYRQLTDDPSPLIICCNHLTFVDSILLIYAFGHHLWYFPNFRRLSWNMPASNYRSNLLFRVVFFFSKCLCVDRDGSKEHKREMIDVAHDLLSRGEIITLFPEGRRSRTGRFDETKLAFGVGKIAAQLPKCRVLCVYMRSRRQPGASRFPPKGAELILATELLHYRATAEAEVARTETITNEVAAKIKQMERAFFGEAPCGLSAPDRSESHLPRADAPPSSA